MSEVRIIIAGSRDFYRYKILEEEVTKFISSIKIQYEVEDEDITIISGTARGTDEMGEKYAIKHEYDLARFPADWSIGKRAGYIRNEAMAKYAIENNNIGILIAFWDGKSKGTKNMINIAEKQGLKVHIVMI